MIFLRINTINALVLTAVMLLTNLKSSAANSNFDHGIVAQADRTVEGQSGGSTDSQGCGFVSSEPSYEMNLEQRVDYMRLTVEADGGQPTLLVIGPNAEDSFCVLGDETLDLKPEISGVWEAGYYQIYVGDRTRSKHNFTLDISNDN